MITTRRDPHSRIRRQSGTTLIELIVSASIFVGIIVASATLYSIALNFYITDKLTQDVQREGDSVTALMTNKIREGVSYSAASTASDFSFNLSVGSRRFYAFSNQLHYVDETGTDQTLLEPSTTISNLVITPSPAGGATLSSVKLTGTLTRTKGSHSSTFTLSSTISTRPQ